MEKKIIQKPVYETRQVQVGIEDKEVWVTSDGREFFNQEQAEDHESKLLTNERNIHFPYYVRMYYFCSKEQVSDWKKKQGSHTVMKFDEFDFQYPNWFVIYDTTGEDEDYYEYYDMKHFDDFEGYVVSLMQDAKK